MKSVGSGLGVLILSVLLLGCPGGGPQELLDTAQLEEVQRNLPHARKLYAEILERHPESPQAATARARLEHLESDDPGS